MKYRILYIGYFVSCLMLAVSVNAQRVGVVLSGGGAKGLAHIGVLKALEENDIPVDYIAGTSMGAIVGGMYASGMSTDEMAELINSDEFKTWLSGVIEDEYRFFYIKEDYDAEWINARFNLDSVIAPNIVPTSIISPYQMDFAFMKYFAQPGAACGYDFDNLMVPFRCIASNIEDNRAYVCRSGDLGSAVRASMSFPFYFKPIAINGKVMMDGGMYNNFPVDVMMEDFNPDVIIGSVVAGNYNKPSTDDMISMLQSIFMSNTNYTIADSLGVLVEPDVRYLDLLDFSTPNAIIDSGYTAISRKMDAVKAKIERRVTPSEVSLKRSIFKDKFPPLLFQNINPIGLNPRQSDYVNMLLKQESDILTLNQLKPNYFRLVADDKIASVYPRSRFNPGTGYFDLFLLIDPAKDFTVSFGGNVTSSAANQAFLGLRYKLLTRYSWTISGNIYIGSFYNSVMLKTRLEYPSDPAFYAEISGVINGNDYFTTSRYFVGDESPSFLVKNDNYLRFNGGVPVTNTSKLGIDFTGSWLSDSYYHTNAFTRQDTSDITRFDNFSVGMIYEKNTITSKAYPSAGEHFLASLRYVGGTEKYTPGSTSLRPEPDTDRHRWIQLHLKYENYFMTLGDVIFGVYGEGMLSNRELFSNYTATVVSAPGFSPVPQSNLLFIPEYRANIWAGLGVRSVWTVFNPVDLRVNLFSFFPYQEFLERDDQSVYYDESFQKRYFGGSAALVLNNPVLPASISVTYYARTEQPWQILFNLGYIIFNRPGIY